MNGRVLIVAGSDSGGGAGIQADIKTVTLLGGYAATAVTALTAQNTLAVSDIMPVPANFVRAQMMAVLSDIGADVIKTGMLCGAAIIEAVADTLEDSAPSAALVVDPVMIATTGRALLDEQALETLKSRLIARATIVTPNLSEAERLTGVKIAGVDDMHRAADRLRQLGAQVAMVKGGHLPGDLLADVIADAQGHWVIEAKRVATASTHGTGCTLASAIATGLAQGLLLRPAIERAHAYVQKAIRNAPGLGRGKGPLGPGV